MLFSSLVRIEIQVSQIQDIICVMNDYVLNITLGFASSRYITNPGEFSNSSN